MPLPPSAVEDLLERSIIHALNREGHSLYLRHPITKEVLCVTITGYRDEVEQLKVRLRRILGGIIRAALQPPPASEPTEPQESA